ncbi:hypothetical protein B0I35DRAFT_333079, partial [Stachybotrys elegans]
QRDVVLFRRPINSLANVPVLNKWLKAEINHWAVCVGDTCYEVASTPAGAPSHSLFIRSKSEWLQLVEERGTLCTRQEMGPCVTNWPDDMIAKCADEIWTKLFDSKYENFMQNCQEFAFWLLCCIVINLNQKQIKDRWESFNPDRVIPALLTGGGAGFVGGTALAGAVSDAALTFGVVTSTLGAVGLTSFFVERHKRHKKGKELARSW